MLKKQVLKLTALILCLLVVFPSVAFAQADRETLQVAYIGNATHPDRLLPCYSDLISTFLQEKTGSDIKTVTIDPLDFSNTTFQSTAVQADGSDIIFVELDVSKKYADSDDVLSAKLEALMQRFLSGSKLPTVYFIYTPESSFIDNRAPFEKVAQRYGVMTIDLATFWQSEYKRGKMPLREMFTAGIIPGGKGHTSFAEYVISQLKVKDSVISPIKKVEAKADVSAYMGDDPIEEPKPELKTDGTVLYVALNGDDANDGSINAPLKTFKAARDRIRAVKKKEGKNFGGATVNIREGVYSMDSTLNLTEEDSGTDTAGVIWQGYPGETVQLVGGKVLDPADFKPVTDATTLERLRTNARGKVYVYDLGTRGIEPGEFVKGPNVNKTTGFNDCHLGNLLIVNGQNESRARYPNGEVSNHIKRDTPTDATFINHDVYGCERWETATDAFAWVQVGQGFRANGMKVKDFDSANMRIKFYTSPDYIAQGAGGWPWHLINLLEELDCPGEWYVDKDKSLLYYFPRDDFATSEIVFGTNENTLIHIENTNNVTVANIIMECNCVTPLTVHNCENTLITECTFRNLGEIGATITCDDNVPGYGNNGITKCEFMNIAVAGVKVIGGDRERLTYQGNYVDNCYFDRYSFMNQGGSAVTASGTVGTRITHNTIHNANGAAIYMNGNDDYIAYNEIYNVVKNTDDLGAIYGDHRGAHRQGVQFLYNYMHDILVTIDVDNPQGSYYNIAVGFYCDAGRNNGARCEHNAFANVNQAMFVSNNQNMVMNENVVLDSPQGKSAISTAWNWASGYSPSGPNTLEGQEALLAQQLEDGTFMDVAGKGESTPGVVNRLLYRAYQSTPEFTAKTEKNYYLKYPWLENYLYNHPLQSKDVLVTNNGLFDQGAAKKAIGLLQPNYDWMQQDNNYITNDAVTAEMAGSDSTFARVKKAMEITKEKVGTFEIWDVSATGVEGLQKEVGDFAALYPLDGAKELDVDDLSLAWDYALGADEYHAQIATDPEFKNIVFDGTTTNNGINVRGLEIGAKTYYWRVSARSYSERFTGNPSNSNGVRSFSTMRFKEADKTALGEEIASGEEILATMTEGTEAGNLAVGSKARLEKALTEANTVYNNPRIGGAKVEQTTDTLHKEIIGVLSSQVLREVDVFPYLSSPDKITLIERGKPGAASLEENPGAVQFENDSVAMAGGYSISSNEVFGANTVFRFTAKIAVDEPEKLAPYATYSTFALRHQGLQSHVWSNLNYFYLVTSTATELQSAKGKGQPGGYYYSHENKLFTLNEEHDVQMAAIMVDDGKAVRHIIMVDGVIDYDYIDTVNPLENEGSFNIWTHGTAGTVVIKPAKKDTGYPSLLELLNDPNSAINNPTETAAE